MVSPLLPGAALVGTLALIDRHRRNQALKLGIPDTCCGAKTLASITSRSSLPSSPLLSSSSSLPTPVIDDLAYAGMSKAEVGRATWSFLHAVASQYPDNPTGQQQRDAKALIDLMTRLYPCKECATHFGALVKEKPPRVRTGPDFRVWMCEVHNSVNMKLGKPVFDCTSVDARWGRLDCDEPDKCRIQGR